MGEECPAPDAGNYTLTINLACHGNATKLLNFTKDAQKCRYELNYESPYACAAMDLSLLYYFVAENRYIAALIGMIMGNFILFFGLNMFRKTLFIFGFLIGSIGTLVRDIVA